MNAEDLIRLNIPVFPCDDRKRPLVAGGFKAATTDPDAIRASFSSSKAVMAGTPTGISFFVIDIDIKSEFSGLPWLEENEEAMPPTRRHRTRSGGLHLLFSADEYPRNSASMIAPGVDVRGIGGYIIIPPSPGYAVIDPSPIADVPRWLLSACRKRPPAPPPETIIRGVGPTSERVLSRICRAAEKISGCPEGSRNDTLNREAYFLGVLAREGLTDRDTVYGAVYHAARQAGLPDPEVKATIRSALRAAHT